MVMKVGLKERHLISLEQKDHLPSSSCLFTVRFYITLQTFTTDFK
jgi:hypothetical protein